MTRLRNLPRGSPRVAVCGAPRSGNRLTEAMLLRHGFAAEIRHYADPKPFFGGHERPHVAVMPLRDPVAQWLSCERDGPQQVPQPDLREFRRCRSAGELHYAHFAPTLRAVARWGVPFLPVVYEDIVADPEGEGRRIVAWCSNQAAASVSGVGPLAWKGWGVDVIDGNAKWAERMAEGRGGRL